MQESLGQLIWFIRRLGTSRAFVLVAIFDDAVIEGSQRLFFSQVRIVEHQI
jgi:hypothetical protein